MEIKEKMQNVCLVRDEGKHYPPWEALFNHEGTHNLSTASFYHLQIRTGTIRPVGIKSAIEARLHLRVANIGHPSEGPKGKLG